MFKLLSKKRQLFLVCIGFAFAALTICAIYVNTIGMDTGYQTLSRKQLTEHILSVTGQEHRLTEMSHAVAGSKTTNGSHTRTVTAARNSGSIKTNTTRPLPTKKQEKNATVLDTGSHNQTLNLHDLSNASDVRTLSRQRVSMIDGVLPVNATPDPLYTHHGYISVLDPKKKLNLHCMQCALVSSSGQLLGSRVGYLIDEADCIFRMNDAPVPSYEEDVGSRTTVRVVGHAATPNLKNKRKFLLQDSSSRYVVGWGPSKAMQTNGKGYAYKHLKDLTQKFPKVGFFYLTQEQMAKADEIFEAETGKPRMGSGTYLSTGWFTMVLARASCDEIHVYGMVNDEYCQNLTNKNVPYHYYDRKGRKECDYYRANEKGKKGVHRFITEKSIFARWALEQPPIYFHVPDWNPR
ncbi:alpha-N-acetylgalactosaminide alpha-2,6-sialyltransferase 3-like isoform X2 [Patiria miniata]|uniref:Alpha-N-acetylgalactosaminide alpha-2,6-sialyltransferase 3 n=1 Tax=Patiria miniata TaxID=46514 RepID=A0A913Z672_PATMI|nr:alpha-N-acetylgalactosaminide alpha-2,6-sialyltransferase 3-like isoform X2 [Patiria miniata]